MSQATRAGAAQWVLLLVLSALLGALVFACVGGPLAPVPGVRESDELSLIHVPGGAVSAAGGNFMTERTDLALDTRLGPLAIGAVYNSASGWTWSFDVSYRNGAFRDDSGAQHSLAALANGAPVPGTHWVKVDATRVKTKGGLVHEFDAASGRLVAVRYASSAQPHLRFVQTQLATDWRTTAIEQCLTVGVCANLVTIEYDAAGRPTSARDHTGRVASFAHDSAGKLTLARDAHDAATGRPGARYEYSGDHLAALVSSDGERVEIASDGLGRALQVRGVGAGDPTWTFAYAAPDAVGQFLTTARDPLGHATVYALDGARALRSVSNALGERTTYAWSAGRIASVERPDGTRTTFGIADDDVVSEVEPSGNVITTSYQPGGVDRDRPLARPIARVADSLGLREARGYDAAGRLLTVSNGAGETTTFAYHPDETLASVRAPDGSTLVLADHGTHGHAARLSFDGQSWASAQHDALGNELGASWPSPMTGGVQSVAFDADRNPATLELADQPASGAPSVQPLVLEQRADGRPLRVLRPYGGEARFGYDALGRLVTLAERASPTESADATAVSVTTWTYDALGRVTSQERANGMREEREYDALGRLSRTRTLRAGVVETDVRFEFANGRLVRAHDAASGFDESYAWDSARRVAEVVHSLGERTRFAYDARSRLVRTELVMPGGAALAALTHGYDAAGRETRLGYLGADLLALGFASGVHDETRYGNGLRRKQFRDTKSGRATGRELWRGTTRLEKSDYGVRSAIGGELTRLRTDIAAPSPAAGVTQEDFAYASSATPPGMDRRAVSGATAVGGATVSEELAYDHLSNLVARTATAPWPTGGTFTTTAALIYNAEHNRLLRATITGPLSTQSDYGYDAAGFVIEQTVTVGSLSGVTRFDWNARGQIRTIETNGSVDASFAYDALGRRRERFANGSLRRWRFGGLVEAAASDQPVAIDLGEVRIQLDGRHRYRHADWRGNTKLVSNQAGEVETQHAFSAYGRSASLGAREDDRVFARGDVIHAGFSALVALGVRLYDPALARFLAPDPIWSPINQYAYTLGNPVDFWDDSGMHTGRHNNLAKAGVVVAAQVLLVVGAVFLIATVSAPVALAGAMIGAGAAVLMLVAAIIELNEQIEVHREQTRAEWRRDALLRSGGRSVWTGRGVGGGYSTEVVCSDDGSTVWCTRRRSGIASTLYYQPSPY